MKQNRAFKVDGCGECPDGGRISSHGWKCDVFEHEAATPIRLFEKCRLPEIKEIKVWFEKRPPEAQVLDLYVSHYPMNYPNPWVVELKVRDKSWFKLANFPEKAQAEEFLGCKIPD